MSNLPDGYTPTNRRMMNEVKPKTVRRYMNYRPVGFLVTISILTFLQLSDMGVSLPVALLVTMLVAILTLMFS